MKRHPVTLALRAAMLASLVALPLAGVSPGADRTASVGPASTGGSQGASPASGQLPIAFEVNKGQAPAGVRYLARSRGFALTLSQQGADLAFEGRGGKTAVVGMSLVGADEGSQVSGRGKLDGVANDLRGSDPSRWRTNIPTYSKVAYRQVLPGTDLVFYSKNGQLEYDVVLAPRADPGRVTFAIAGVDRLSVDQVGDLLMHTPAGILRQHRPLIYQEVGGARRKVTGNFVLGAPGRVGFQVGNYDRNRTLVIDPTLSWSTTLTGTGSPLVAPALRGPDLARGVATGSNGEAYVTGSTMSPDFPTTLGAHDLSCGTVAPCDRGQTGPYSDAFVTKLNTGGSIAYSTYLGGNAGDVGNAIAVNSSGEAYVTGHAQYSKDFPTVRAYKATRTCTTDPPFNKCVYPAAFVTKLNAAGSSLDYSTYLSDGNTAGSVGYGIAVSSNGNAYVTGTTSDSAFPTTAPAGNSAYDQTCGAGNDCGANAVFTDGSSTSGSTTFTTAAARFADTDAGLKLNNINIPDGTTIESVTNATTVVLSTAAIATGSSLSFSIVGRYQQRSDGFLAQIDPGATGFASLVYSTFLGGTGSDGASGIAVDASGVTTFAYVSGYTASTNFPTTAPSGSSPYDNACGTGTNCNAANASGTDGVSTNASTTYTSTTAGFTVRDLGLSITGTNIPAGTTIASVTDATTAVLSAAATANGTGLSFTIVGRDNPKEDAFVAKLDPGASGSAGLVYSTYIGGSDVDLGNGVALDTETVGGVTTTYAYLTGSTASTNFPTASAYDTTSNGGGDAFVTKINGTGSGLTYSTYLGGSGYDIGYAITTNSSGEAYVTGEHDPSASTLFPTVSAIAGGSGTGAGSAFVSKLASAGTSLNYSTYLGSSFMVGRGIAVTGSNVLVAGRATGDYAFVAKVAD